EAGPLGYPVTGLICGMRDGGCGQVFQGGRIYSSPATGAHAMSGAIHTAWVQQGYEVGPLGYPSSGAVLVPGGTAQGFQGGRLEHDQVTGRVVRS
ncbi:sugar dehydrogenase, partial [Modestobacter sp. VKM Ac-2983]|uniref:LGFP repeat-containing protein n=1 Tax=Modestobacter sp. VKM Ac-2983 TaxID=3004137 RepID=UPI0022BCEAA5|nr:sugar dehydrogenase [Modestobacter sp. VKM Ac-2983]